MERGDDCARTGIGLDYARDMHLNLSRPGQRLAERWAGDRHCRGRVSNRGDSDGGPVELRRVETGDINPKGRRRADATAADGIGERYLVAAEGHFI